MKITRASAFALPFILLAALGLSARPAAAQSYPLQSYSFGGHTYFLTQTAENWNAAEAEAVADGGHLTAITSAGENTFITQTFASSGFPLWLGGTDLVGSVRTASYYWTNGEPFVYNNWQPGEPNNGGNGTEDYAAIGWNAAAGYTSDASTWNDLPLNGTKGFGGKSDGPYFGVVEVAAAPEPSQTAALGLGVLGLGGLLFKARKRMIA